MVSALIFLSPFLGAALGGIFIYFSFFKKEKVRAAAPKVATGIIVIVLAWLAHRWSLIFDEQTRKKKP